jgi:hypothetical protein
MHRLVIVPSCQIHLLSQRLAAAQLQLRAMHPPATASASTTVVVAAIVRVTRVAVCSRCLGLLRRHHQEFRTMSHTFEKMHLSPPRQATRVREEVAAWCRRDLMTRTT